jgi:hypothetical protein
VGAKINLSTDWVCALKFDVRVEHALSNFQHTLSMRLKYKMATISIILKNKHFFPQSQACPTSIN